MAEPNSIEFTLNINPVGTLAEILVKQIPQPPLIPKKGWLICPSCTKPVGNSDGRVFAYCQYCGQRIDYTDYRSENDE